MLPELFLGNVHVVGLADALLLRFALYPVKLGIGELGGLALNLAHGPAVYGGVARKPSYGGLVLYGGKRPAVARAELAFLHHVLHAVRQ